MSPDPPEQPLVVVTAGGPSEAELAALVAVLAARRRAPSSAGPRSESSAWSAPSRRLRQPLYPGPDGWARSSMPR